jgi:hypothetical protein
MEAGSLLDFFLFVLKTFNEPSEGAETSHATEFQEFPPLPCEAGNQMLSKPSRGMVVVEIISRHKPKYFSLCCQTGLI